MQTIDIINLIESKLLNKIKDNAKTCLNKYFIEEV